MPPLAVIKGHVDDAMIAGCDGQGCEEQGSQSSGARHWGCLRGSQVGMTAWLTHTHTHTHIY